MTFSDIVLVSLLLILLALGGVYIYISLGSGETINFEEYEAQIARDLPDESSQFYANMRYQEKSIGYGFSETCTSKRILDFEKATEAISKRTIISFYRSSNPQITVTCSERIQAPLEKGHFIAGEGGPTSIINATNYAVILNGSIALYRPDTCDNPQIAIHELLHALGFNHNSNENSIMFPITKCSQEIDEYIIKEINRVYSRPSLPDLIIEKVSANKTGRYLSLYLIVSNYGLREAEDTTLVILADNIVVERYDTKNLEVGTRKTVTITNLQVPRKNNRITLSIETTQEEITKNNNLVELNPIVD